MAAPAFKVIMVRHGESVYNQENRFCGWHDADLAPTGLDEAKKAGKVTTLVFSPLCEHIGIKWAHHVAQYEPVVVSWTSGNRQIYLGLDEPLHHPSLYA